MSATSVKNVENPGTYTSPQTMADVNFIGKLAQAAIDQGDDWEDDSVSEFLSESESGSSGGENFDNLFNEESNDEGHGKNT